MRDHFFLHYGWFFQNLRKEAVRTFMHTTVGSAYIGQLQLIEFFITGQIPEGLPWC